MKRGEIKETFHPNGQLASRGNYVDREPIGLFEWFDEEGNLIWTENYESEGYF